MQKDLSNISNAVCNRLVSCALTTEVPCKMSALVTHIMRVYNLKAPSAGTFLTICEHCMLKSVPLLHTPCLSVKSQINRVLKCNHKEQMVMNVFSTN